MRPSGLDMTAAAANIFLARLCRLASLSPSSLLSSLGTSVQEPLQLLTAPWARLACTAQESRCRRSVESKRTARSRRVRCPRGPEARSTCPHSGMGRLARDARQGPE